MTDWGDQYNLADGKRLHLGIGVAIVKKTFPFHRSHALAEQLAASAKRLLVVANSRKR